MFIQINKDEFLKEISKKAWYQTNIVTWTIIFLFPLFFIIDLIYAKDIWIQVTIGRRSRGVPKTTRECLVAPG